ncbi:MAG: PorV/PorQ family protein [Bacteroidota bacterium]
MTLRPQHSSTPRALAALVLGVLVSLPLLASRAEAQDKIGTASAEFLNIPVGPRATAMGGAFGAIADDLSAVYWNPAGLARIDGGRLAFEYASWLESIDFNHASVAATTSFGTVGLSFTAMTTPEMARTTEFDQEGLSGETFTAGSYAVGLTYARALTDRFLLGATVKVLHESIYEVSATGVAFDIGTMFTTPFNGLRLGASISNFGTKMQLGGDGLLVPVDTAPDQEGNNNNIRSTLATEAFDLPLNMRVGIATEVYQTAETRVTLAVDAVSPSAAGQYVNLGGEVALLGGLVQVRGGYQELFLDDSPRSFTLGGGLNYGFGSLDLTADYAYEAFEFFDGVNRISFALGF